MGLVVVGLILVVGEVPEWSRGEEVVRGAERDSRGRGVVDGEDEEGLEGGERDGSLRLTPEETGRPEDDGGCDQAGSRASLTSLGSDIKTSRL
jgi:hypothetical protein